ncbi:hypothetical protein [Pontimicrobium aquaticum]|uniref:Uncharacterized protein n=1 Tax=Pontimicrobium aquaticum TaxID=2565367 RepID=A0A4U0F4I9_9FLAO|nr:hypothetical protein [Pontimicrobium aquaticum]TJY37702.1 hypothetical protein E5167_00155 [Pontimicrobium aquaticum]
MSKFNLITSRLVLVLILSLSFHCKEPDNDTKQEQETTTELVKITPQDINTINYTEFVLSNLARKKVNDWTKFKTLETEIENLKSGTLSFFKDDKAVLQGFITDLKNEVPESLNKPSILVRLSVLETAMYKFDETINLQSSTKEAILKDIERLLLAQNNFIYQINKVIEKASQNIIKP